MKKIADINRVLGDDIRLRMIGFANIVSEKKKAELIKQGIPSEEIWFKLSEVINEENFEREIQKHKRVLREHFLALVNIGVFVKRPNKYLYRLNAELIKENCKDMEKLVATN